MTWTQLQGTRRPCGWHTCFFKKREYYPAWNPGLLNVPPSTLRASGVPVSASVAQRGQICAYTRRAPYWSAASSHKAFLAPRDPTSLRIGSRHPRCLLGNVVTARTRKQEVRHNTGQGRTQCAACHLHLAQGPLGNVVSLGQAGMFFLRSGRYRQEQDVRHQRADPLRAPQSTAHSVA